MLIKIFINNLHKNPRNQFGIKRGKTVGNPVDVGDLLQEARAIFPNTKLAYDFLTYEVPRNRVLAVKG